MLQKLFNCTPNYVTVVVWSLKKHNVTRLLQNHVLIAEKWRHIYGSLWIMKSNMCSKVDVQSILAYEATYLLTLYQKHNIRYMVTWLVHKSYFLHCNVYVSWELGKFPFVTKSFSKQNAEFSCYYYITWYIYIYGI